MSASDLARAQREALCDALTEAGPDAPTLIDGWTARDLAAHIVVREGRPDAALGVFGGPLAQWTDRVLSGAASEPFDKLVRLIRKGPPIWSTFRLPIVDGQGNTIEYFLHTEDIRRAGEGWQPRGLDPEMAEFLWGRLRSGGRGLFGKSDVGVVLHRTDTAGKDGAELTVEVHQGEPTVDISGDPGELTLLAHGRTAHRARVDGSADAVEALVGSLASS